MEGPCNTVLGLGLAIMGRGLRCIDTRPLRTPLHPARCRRVEVAEPCRGSTLVATPPLLRGACRPICWNRKPVLLVSQRARRFVSPAFSSAASRMLLRAALRRCGGASVCTAASGVRLQQAARHAKQVLPSHPLARRANEQRATFALPHHRRRAERLRHGHRRSPLPRCSSNHSMHPRCRAQRSLHSRRLLIGRR